MSTNVATTAKDRLVQVGFPPVQAEEITKSALPLDSNGNYLANITPRADTKANLLALTSGGIGELSWATDTHTYIAQNAAGTHYEFSPMAAGTWNDALYTLNGLGAVLSVVGKTTSGVTTDGGGIIISGGNSSNVTSSGNGGSITLQGGSSQTSQAGSLLINYGTSPNRALCGAIDIGPGAIQVGSSEAVGGPAFGSAVGFHGNVPVLQQTPALAGSAGTIPSNTGAALNQLATFNGTGSGSAYTINQIVAALKNIGLLAT
jgi:hypothetical protein